MVLPLCCTNPVDSYGLTTLLALTSQFHSQSPPQFLLVGHCIVTLEWKKRMMLPPSAISVEPVQKGAGRGFLGGQVDAARGEGWEHPGSPDHQGSRAEPLRGKDSTGNASPALSSTSAYSCSITSWKPMARGKVPPHCPTSSI